LHTDPLTSRPRPCSPLSPYTTLFRSEVVQEARPAIVGSLAQPDLADLKHFGAATATSGGVEIYHIPGITPEAPTLEAAFGGSTRSESTRLNSSHVKISYAVFCLKKTI